MDPRRTSVSGTDPPSGSLLVGYKGFPTGGVVDGEMARRAGAGPARRPMFGEVLIHFVQENIHMLGNFITVFFQCKVAGLKQVEL